MLEEIGSAKGVVVQQQDHISAASRDPMVCGGRVAWISGVGDQRDVWEKRLNVLGSSVCRSPVGDDDSVLDGLVPELLEASSSELPPLMCRDHNVDRTAHVDAANSLGRPLGMA